jgi:hypothetical protein
MSRMDGRERLPGKRRLRIRRFVQVANSLHGNHLTLRRNCIPRAKVRGFSGLRNLLIVMKMTRRRPFSISVRQGASASKMVGCQFPGTQKNCVWGERIRRNLRKTNAATTQSRARFRAYAFSTGGSTASLRDVLPLRSGRPQPNCTF